MLKQVAGGPFACLRMVLILLLAGIFQGASYSPLPTTEQAQQILALAQRRAGEDPRLGYAELNVRVAQNKVYITGKVANPEQKFFVLAGLEQLKIPIVDQIEVFPFQDIANDYALVHPNVIDAFDQPNGTRINQFLHGTALRILKTQGDWALVQGELERYVAWVKFPEIMTVRNDQYAKLWEFDRVMILSKEAPVYQNADLTQAVGSLYLGTQLFFTTLVDNSYKVLYPTPAGMQIGYIAKEQVRLYVPNESIPIDSLIKAAYSYVDTPYAPGGNSIVMWDGSGFIQTLFKLQGVDFPREWSQQRQSTFPVRTLEYLKAGDLIFFEGQVGLYLGEKKVILPVPQLGKVAIISLDENAPNYQAWYAQHFLHGGRLTLLP